ncbi:MAG: 50S ribosomal protein L35 [Candidatus Stygibacter australis]|jgi:large subunit ribosomal protein L35|nr:50S ribosomal protein L35 [Candidatus Stygibacter australis]MDP8322882.1 50S ribosomal protein L35 [Candidatus Stygibacter australis]
MPKLKTRRCVAKRFKKTGTGKLKRSHAFAGHFFTKKSATRKRNLRHSDLVSSSDASRMKKMLGM